MICAGCGGEFKTKSAKRRHKKSGDCPGEEDLTKLPRDARRAAFECMAEDLPDGAYFAMAEEFGLEPTDLID
jgi:hypothetical protein